MCRSREPRQQRTNVWPDDEEERASNRQDCGNPRHPPYRTALFAAREQILIICVVYIISPGM
jgi:hypothetical protein